MSKNRSKKLIALRVAAVSAASMIGFTRHAHADQYFFEAGPPYQWNLPSSDLISWYDPQIGNFFDVPGDQSATTAVLGNGNQDFAPESNLTLQR